MKTYTPHGTLLGHDLPVRDITLLPNSNAIISASWDVTARFWDLDDDDVTILRGHPAWVYALAYSPDGTLLASGGGWRPSHDGTTRIWCAQTGDLLHVHHTPPDIRPRDSIVWEVEFSPDGQQLAFAQERAVTILNRDSTESHAWSVVRRIKYDSGVQSISYHPEGATMAVGHWEPNILTIIDVATEQTIRKYPSVGRPRARYSDDGRFLAIVGENEGALLVDADSFDSVSVILNEREPELQARDFAFSPDGRWLAVSWYGTNNITLWDTALHRQVAELVGHTGEMLSLDFSPDGTRLATGSGDTTVRLWDIPSGREALTLHGHGFGVHAVAFSPDGRSLASSSGDRTIRIWDARNGTR